MSLSETTFRRLVAILALILAVASIVDPGGPYLAYAVILLAIVLLI